MRAQVTQASNGIWMMYRGLNYTLFYLGFLLVIPVHFICVAPGIDAVGGLSWIALSLMFTGLWALVNLLAYVVTFGFGQGYIMFPITIMYISFQVFNPSGIYTKFASMSEYVEYYKDNSPSIAYLAEGSTGWEGYNLLESAVEESWIDFELHSDTDRYTLDKFEAQWEKGAHWFRHNEYPKDKPPSGLIPKYLGTTDSIKNGGSD